MKTADLRAKTPDELKQSLLNLRKEQFNFRFQKSTGQLENTGSIRAVRRDIAKVKTILLNELKSGKKAAKLNRPRKKRPTSLPPKRKLRSKENATSRILEGKVVSNKNTKTVTVLVERKVRDPLYGKIIRRSAKYAAHDETNQWKIGDQVSIEECRPLSKTKKWRVISGKATGESQVKTVDDQPTTASASVKKAVAEKAAPKTETKKK